MLRYCAWCGRFQGATLGDGHQIRKNVCEIDTLTICPACLTLQVEKIRGDRSRSRTDRS